MRIQGTKCKPIDDLPANALPVSEFATANGIKVGAVYMRFTRFEKGYTTSGGNQSKGSDPGYEIRCYKGINFVVPNKN